jgi:polysaccharide pyruvyl transferase CsaB
MPAGARKVLLAGYFGFGNAGDEAILASMLADLRRLRPDLDAVVASGNPAATAAEHGVRSVRRDDLPAVIAAVRASDLVILGGGGLFEDYWEVPLDRIFTPRSGGLPFYAGFALLAAWLGRPAMVYAAGVGPLASPEGRRLTRVVFDLCAAATVRDEKSLALLESLGARAEVAADPAFGFAIPTRESLAPLLATLGLEPGERPVGVALRPWSFGPDPEVWEAEVAAGLACFLAESEERLLLLPFQAGDLDLLRRLRAALDAGVRERALLVERRLNVAELAGVTAACGRVLAMRFHAALFALAAGVPVAALAYDPKVASLLAAAGLADVALEPGDWRGEEIVRVLRGARAPAAGFPDAMRRRAARSAELVIELLERELPAASAASESARFLDDLAVDKVAAAFRLEIEQSERLSAQAREIGNAAQVARDLAAANARIPRLEQESAALREQRELILAERNDLDRRLTALERTLAYRLVSRFWRLLRQVFPEGSRRRKLYRLGRRAAGKLLGARDPAGSAAWTAGAGGAAAAGESPESSPDFRAELLRFEERVRASGASPSQRVVAIFSGTQLIESEGQRPTQLALALARRGIPVVFVYWRWWDHEWRPQDRLDEGIVQVPIDVVTRRPEMLTGAFAFAEVERIALFEFPHPAFFATLSAANSAGWITVYDMLDDWEEFHRVGQAIWWDEDFERHLASACDAVFGINEVLAGRLRALGGDAAEVVGNGLKPGLGTVGAPRPLARGELTVGYFGYLSGAWFDWDLLLEAARRRPAWRFYLIGYGGAPEGAALPANVDLLGKQPQADLAAFAANWDVAVVPFKPDRLAAGADPIKTYEYLAMGLPVVVTGVHPPPGGEAFVRRAEPETGVDGFLRAIEQTGGRGGTEQEAARGAFAAGCSWDHRLESLLASLAEGRQRVAEKRALFAEPAP